MARERFIPYVCGLILVLVTGPGRADIDLNGNSQSDLWELEHSATGFTAGVDSDDDGHTNEEEGEAGTDPLDETSCHTVTLVHEAGGRSRASWSGLAGKQYELQCIDSLPGTNWIPLATWMGGGSNQLADLTISNSAYYRVVVRDIDTDGDGLSDWEELLIGFDPTSSNTARYWDDDFERVEDALGESNSVSMAAIDDSIIEDWPDPGVVSIRRAGNLDPLTIGFTISGTATAGVDYVASATGSVTIPTGYREAWIEFDAVDDAVTEGDETIVVTLSPGTGYTVAGTPSVTVTIHDPDPSGLPSAEEAARFLIQCTMGPTSNLISSVETLGFEGWIDDQFTKTTGYHQPFLVAMTNAGESVWSEEKMFSWWDQAMHAEDHLRQRVAYALSQIIVISDRASALDAEPVGMANFYDMLLRHSFGNYRDILYDTTRHPMMGLYLSHLGNRPPDSTNNIFPDENFAREVMQLFSIGLWELNPDGTQIMSNNAPIPTYDNGDITQFARVFTGMTFAGGDTNLWWEFIWPPYSPEDPMDMWELFHDKDEKILLRGTVLPAGQTGLQDLSDAIDNLFEHPNTGPFVGRRLIQRLVKSNPSTGYVARVTAAFNDNGSGVRGDMKAVLKAILLDPEARDAAWLDDDGHGKLREPYLRFVQLARAFNASADNGRYDMRYLGEVFMQQPMSSPSVFNFYQPDYQPSGDLKQRGLFAPEFQITTAVSAISVPNHMFECVHYHLNRWGGTNTNTWVTLELDVEDSLASDPDSLIAHLDLILTQGRLAPANHQVIREAIERMDEPDPREVVDMALYLFTVSPEFSTAR